MIEKAMHEWRGVLDSSSIELSYLTGTFNDSLVESSIKISPRSEAQVQEVLKIAVKYKVPLHPFSSGRNWGYGSASPNDKDSVLLDLSRLNEIYSFDSETGAIVLGPGVTQIQLYEFLSKNNFSFFVPTTGAGKECSILGNALERGYGITPYADHFEAITRLRILLADGRILDGPFSNATSKINNLHKYGIGPYLDGIFSQSSFGIILRGALKLKRKAPNTDFFMIKIFNPDVGRAVRIVKRISEECGSLVSQMNIMDDQRISASMLGGDKPNASSHELLSLLCRLNPVKVKSVGEWNIVGAIYSHPSNQKFLKKVVSQIAKSEKVKVSFVSKSLRNFILSASKFKIFKSQKQKMLALVSGYDLLDGIPNNSAQGLIKNFSKMSPQEKDGLQFKDLGVGLRWFSPLIPNQTNEICNFVELLREKFKELKLTPLITLTRLDDLHYDASIPLLYNSEQQSECERIDKCLSELNNTFINLGLEPYRLGVKNSSSVLSEFDQNHWQLIHQLKKFFDPDEIISRGRYYY